MNDGDLIKWLLWAMPISSFVIWTVTYFSLKTRLYNLQNEFECFIRDSKILAPVKIEQVLPDKSGDYLIVYSDAEFDKQVLFTIYMPGEQLNKFELKAGHLYWKNPAGWFLIPDNSSI